MQTSCESIFACGNVVHVNDLVDNVSAESEQAGKYAALYAMGKFPVAKKDVTLTTGNNVRYLCPQSLSVSDEAEKINVYFRVLQPELGVKLVARCGDTVIAQKREFRVNPGEMNHLTIDSTKIEGNDITVEVVKEG